MVWSGILRTRSPMRIRHSSQRTGRPITKHAYIRTVKFICGGHLAPKKVFQLACSFCLITQNVIKSLLDWLYNYRRGNQAKIMRHSVPVNENITFPTYFEDLTWFEALPRLSQDPFFISLQKCILSNLQWNFTFNKFFPEHSETHFMLA